MGATDHRNGHRTRQVVGTFDAETVNVPRARLIDEAGRTTEWRSQALRRYQRLTRKAEVLIASVYLAGTNTRRVKRALFGLPQGCNNECAQFRWHASERGKNKTANAWGILQTPARRAKTFSL